MRKIQVAVIGAGPAGIYAADILTKEYEHARVDVFDRLPAPVRARALRRRPGSSADQGDHQGTAPRALHATRTCVRFIGNVHYGDDLNGSPICAATTTR